MNKISIIFLVLCLCGSGKAYSQKVSSVNSKKKAFVSSFQSKLSSLYDATIGMSEAELSDRADTVSAISPQLYKMLGPGVYYKSAIQNSFNLGYKMPDESSNEDSSYGISYREDMDDVISRVLVNSYVNNPGSFLYNDTRIQNETLVNSDKPQNVSDDDINAILNRAPEITNVADVVGNVDADLQIKKPNFWKTSGKFSMQFQQNYLSQNWYKGGNNNENMLANLVLEANYNDQKKVQWDNKLDLRLGFMTTTSDSCHSYLTNNDKIYLFSKLGIKATKSWYYTLSMEANTQFMPGYRSNDRRMYSNFLAPLDVYASLGIDFKPALKNGNTLSLALLPFSYKFRYIGTENENIHRNYGMIDLDFKKDYGSRLEFNSKINLAKNFTWKSRLYIFTSYKYVESEIENSLSFAFNKYLSTEVYTLWRFDDSRSRQYYDSTLGYFQFKEYFTFGLSYNF